MAIVKEYRSENCVVQIDDDCFESEESVKKRLEAVAQIIMEEYEERALHLAEDAEIPEM